MGVKGRAAGWAGVATIAAVLATAAAAPVNASPLCDKTATPAGANSLKNLVESLAAGETGCLRAGTYHGPDNGAAVPSPIYMQAPGSTLRSFPGERATIDARLEVTGAGATVTQITIDTATLNTTVTPLKLVGDGSALTDSTVTGHERVGTCVQVGTGNAKPTGVLVERNEIYRCGADDGGTNKFDHNIYVTKAQGTVIRGNVLRDNTGGWGVHLYPDADGTLVEHNMINSDHGGVVFAGDGSGAKSDNNEVRFNSLTYPDTGGGTPRYNLEGSWSGGPTGAGNTAHHNCLHSAGLGSPGGVQNPQSGFTASDNVVLTAGPDGDRAVDQHRGWANNPCSLPATVLAGLP